MIFLSAFKYRRGTSSPDGKILKLDSSKEADAMGTQSANTVFAGPASGGAAVPAFRALAAADLLPVVNAVRIISAPTTVLATDRIILVDMEASTGDVEITFPDNLTNGTRVIVRQITQDPTYVIKTLGSLTTVEESAFDFTNITGEWREWVYSFTKNTWYILNRGTID